MSLDDYLASLASDLPAPGGGSAAMVVAAAACSLIAMVSRICLNSEKYARTHPLAEELIANADRLREECLQGRERDEAAFAAVVAAKGDKDELEGALMAAASEPLAATALSLQALQLASKALQLHNRNLVSDIGCAAEFAYAALRGSAYNVRINHRYLDDRRTVGTQRTQLQAREREAADLITEIREAVSGALGP